MNKKVLNLLTLLAISLTGCNLGNSETSNDTSSSNSSYNYEYNYADVFIFMGQSNMAGRGNASEAIPCEDGHGYEFKSVTGETTGEWLANIEEPFGKYENNDQMTDGNNGDGKKSGSIVSSFAEGYYSTTGIPVIGVSASVGGTSISSWTPSSKYFKESVHRLKACIDYINETELFVIRNINMFWCQGESDGTAYAVNGFDYFGKLQSIVDGMKNIGEGYNVDKCYIIPPSEYGNENKTVLANAQIDYCANHEEFVLASTKFRNVPLSLRDDPHFRQGVYNVVGYDAGTRVGNYIKTGVLSDCENFIPGEEVTLATSYNVTLKYTA